MIAAVIALAALGAGLGAALVWAVRELLAAARAATAQGRALLASEARTHEVTQERDAARAEAVDVTADLIATTERAQAMTQLIHTLRRSRTDVAKATVLDEPPDRVGAAVDRVLATRAAEQAATRAADASDRGDTASDPVSGSGTATGGPFPARVDR